MERRKRGMEMYLTSSGCRSTRDLGSWTCRRRPWSPSSPGAPRSSSLTAPNQHSPSRNPDRIHGRSKTKHLNEIRTLHRSSRVLRGDPSSAVFRASTGFDLRAPPQKGLGQSRSGGGGGREEKRGEGGVTAWGGSRSCGTSARCGWWWPQDSRPRRGTPPRKPSRRRRGGRVGSASLCWVLCSW